MCYGTMIYTTVRKTQGEQKSRRRGINRLLDRLRPNGRFSGKDKEETR